jgi:hypothetical protein
MSMRVNAALRMFAWIAIALSAISFAATLARAAASTPAGSAATTSVTGASPTPKVIATGVPAEPNLLSNGDFSRGSGKAPDHWRTGGWNESPTVTRYDWLHSGGSEPELLIDNLQANDARWLQTLALEQGWYYVGAEVRTEQVPPDAVGATVSLDEDGINSPDLRTDSGWRNLGFYLKVGAHGADVDIALRLGGFGSLNTGRAFFRNARVVKLVTLPIDAKPVFDLSAVRRSLVAPPVGRPWTLVATFLLLATLTVVGWSIYGADDLAPAPMRPQPSPVLPRGERRRQSAKARRR